MISELFNKELFYKICNIETQVNILINNYEHHKVFETIQKDENINIKNILINLDEEIKNIKSKLIKLEENDIVHENNMKNTMNDLVIEQNNKHFKINKQIVIYVLSITAFFASISPTIRDLVSRINSDILKELIFKLL